MHKLLQATGKITLPAWAKPHLLPLLLLVAVTFGSYWSIFDHDFLVNWDDSEYVTGNQAIRGLTLANVKTAFTAFFVGNYAPLHIISYMVDFELWGLNAQGFLLSNLLLHTLSGIIFYAVLMVLHQKRSWAIAATFILLTHPIQVESVAWVSQRKNVLAMLFFLISMLCYILYRKRTPGNYWLYTVSLAAFLCALLTKSVVVVLPLLLIMYDSFFLEKVTIRKLLQDKIPYCIAAAVVALLAFLSQDPAIGGGRDIYWGGSPLNTFYTMLPVLVRYVELLFWPLHLSPAYAQSFKSGIDLEVLLSALLLIAIAVSGIYLYRKNRPLCFWLALFFIALLPVSQIIPLVTLMNDRYLYFPMLGFASFMAGLITTPAAKFESIRKGAAISICVLLMTLPWLTYQKATVWENAFTLWKDAVSNEPGCSLAWLGLGHAYLYRGYVNEALDATLRSYRLFQEDQDTLFNLGTIYLRKREPLQGRIYLLRLIAINPRHYKGLAVLGDNYRMTGELDKAANYYQRALALEPGSLNLLTGLGEIAMETGAYQEADQYFHQAIVAGGDQAQLGYKLAGLACRAGKPVEALTYLEMAFKQGFRGFFTLQQNRDFDLVRARPEFQRLLSTYENRIGQPQ
jgi:Tfp pilus assembly protein PilF